MFAVVPGAVVRNNLKAEAGSKAQRKASNGIHGDRLNSRWRDFKLTIEWRRATVEAIVAGGTPVVRLIAAGFAKAIATRNEDYGRTFDAPRTLNVQRPLANSPSPAFAVWQFSQLSELNPQQVGRPTDGTQRKSDKGCEYLLNDRGIHRPGQGSSSATASAVAAKRKCRAVVRRRRSVRRTALGSLHPAFSL